MKTPTWIDELHGFRAHTPTKQVAWALIKDKVLANGLERVPTINQIKEL